MPILFVRLDSAALGAAMAEIASLRSVLRLPRVAMSAGGPAPASCSSAACSTWHSGAVLSAQSCRNELHASIPPLDGSRVIQSVLTGEALTRDRRLEPSGLRMIGFAPGFFVLRVSPPIRAVIVGVVELMTTAFAVWADVALLLR